MIFWPPSMERSWRGRFIPALLGSQFLGPRTSTFKLCRQLGPTQSRSNAALNPSSTSSKTSPGNEPTFLVSFARSSVVT